MKKKPKCLVSEAMDKCQCDFCKRMRTLRTSALQMYVQFELHRPIAEALRKNGK